MAQAYLGKDEEVEKLIPIIENYSNGKFDMDTFKEQNKKLIELINK